MGLLDLPPELLDEIISHTLVDGFESLAVACKAVYVRAAPQIKRYNAIERVRQYAAAPYAVVAIRKPLQLLYEISRDPLVAQCIDDLNFARTWGPGRGNIRKSDYEGSTYDEEAMENIKKLVTDAGHLQIAGVDAEEWWKMVLGEIEQEHLDEPSWGPHTIISLLSQLPNLTFLRLHRCWPSLRPFDASNGEQKRITYVLDALIEESNSNKGGKRPLGKLETMLPFMPLGIESRAGLQNLQPFMLLNSVRELYAVSCVAVDDGYTGIPFQWRHPTAYSPLRRVELAYCCIDADGISTLLSRTPLVEVFKYSHEMKWHGCQYDWNPGTFNEAIARHCGQNITDLAITIDTLGGDVINGASSFLSYPNLQYLEVDVRIFSGPPIESGQRLGLVAILPEGAVPWNEHDIPCIGSMLPPGIVDVQINADYPHPDKRALISLLKNLKQQRRERLQKLDKCTIRQYDGESARDVVEDIGATWVTFGRKGDPGHRSTMPQWKRDFVARAGYVTDY